MATADENDPREVARRLWEALKDDDVPVAILDAAGRHGRAHDMTVVALRI